MQIPDQINLPFNLILGSGSPRRKSLLKEMGFKFQILQSEADEVYPPGLEPHEITTYLANLKADSLIQNISDTDILLTADTIVCLEKEILNKPFNETEAREMLKSLSGKWHEVITGVCLTTLRKQEVFYASTKVLFSNLSDSSINYYINHFKPFDKAGGYGIQDWIGVTGIAAIEGSYTNVVGLPSHLVYKKLMDMAG